jgi:hypothetical protein
VPNRSPVSGKALNSGGLREATLVSPLATKLQQEVRMCIPTTFFSRWEVRGKGLTFRLVQNVPTCLFEES